MKALLLYSQALWSLDLIPAEDLDTSWFTDMRGALLENRAQAELDLRCWSAAEEDCSAVLQLDSQAAIARFRRASARQQLGREEEALKDVVLVLEARPDDQVVQGFKDELVQEVVAKVRRDLKTIEDPGRRRKKLKAYQLKYHPDKNGGCATSAEVFRGIQSCGAL
ncbi:Spag1 [Symbiodinium sp. CCMP2592]|nr:Spag1 [Symbiodinium sp. CCMP2592]